MSQGETKPAISWNAVTPNDNVTVTYRALWINSGGNLTLRDANGNEETFVVLDSTLLPVQPTVILATGTNATGILGLN